MGEHWPYRLGVIGSSPVPPTTQISTENLFLREGWCFFIVDSFACNPWHESEKFDLKLGGTTVATVGIATTIVLGFLPILYSIFCIYFVTSFVGWSLIFEGKSIRKDKEADKKQ